MIVQNNTKAQNQEKEKIDRPKSRAPKRTKLREIRGALNMEWSAQNIMDDRTNNTIAQKPPKKNRSPKIWSAQKEKYGRWKFLNFFLVLIGLQLVSLVQNCETASRIRYLVKGISKTKKTLVIQI